MSGFIGGGGGGGAPSGAAGGDLGSTYPNPTVVSVANVTTGTLAPARGGVANVTTAGQGFFVGPGITGVIAGLTAVAPSSVANNVKTVQFVLPISITITKITVGITAASASSTVSVGIYSADKNTKLIDSGTFDGATTGVKQNTIGSVTLNPGTYWLAWSGSDTTVTASSFSSQSAYNNTAGVGVLGSAAAVVRGGLSANSVSAGVMPSTLGVISANNNISAIAAVFES